MPLQGNLGVERMCQLAQVSRAGFYRYLQEETPVEEVILCERNQSFTTEPGPILVLERLGQPSSARDKHKRETKKRYPSDCRHLIKNADCKVEFIRFYAPRDRTEIPIR